MTKTLEHRNIIAKILWIIAISMLLIGCRTLKSHTNTETTTKIDRIRDTVIVERFVEVPIKVVEASKSISKSDERVDTTNDSLLIAKLQTLLKQEQYRNSKLAKRLSQVSENRLSMDTVFSKTRYSKAYAFVNDSQLFLHLENSPYDTIVKVLVNDRHIKDSTNVQTFTKTDTTQIIEKKSWFQKLETYLGIVGAILFIFGMISLFRRR